MRSPRRDGHRHQPRQRLAQVAAVVQAGERVAVGELAQRILQPLDLAQPLLEQLVLLHDRGLGRLGDGALAARVLDLHARQVRLVVDVQVDVAHLGRLLGQVVAHRHDLALQLVGALEVADLRLQPRGQVQAALHAQLVRVARDLAAAGLAHLGRATGCRPARTAAARARRPRAPAPRARSPGRRTAAASSSSAGGAGADRPASARASAATSSAPARNIVDGSSARAPSAECITASARRCRHRHQALRPRARRRQLARRQRQRLVQAPGLLQVGGGQVDVAHQQVAVADVHLHVGDRARAARRGWPPAGSARGRCARAPAPSPAW